MHVARAVGQWEHRLGMLGQKAKSVKLYGTTRIKESTLHRVRVGLDGIGWLPRKCMDHQGRPVQQGTHGGKPETTTATAAPRGENQHRNTVVNLDPPALLAKPETTYALEVPFARRRCTVPALLLREQSVLFSQRSVEFKRSIALDLYRSAGERVQIVALATVKLQASSPFLATSRSIPAVSALRSLISSEQ